MRLYVGIVCAAVMLLPLAAFGGSTGRGPAPTVMRKPATTLQLVRMRNHPHPCTPYAGCDIATLTAGDGSQGP